MFKLVLEKAEEPEIKLPTSTGSCKKEEISRKTSISALLTMPKPLTVDHSKLENSERDWIPDHLTCLLRNLYAGQEATVRTGHGTTDWFQIGKGVCQGCILLPCLFNLYAEYIMRNAGLEEAQAGIKTAGRNINNLRYADDQRRQWHPTPVLLPGKSHGRRSLVGCSPWGREESGTTEQLHFHFSLSCIGDGNGNPLQCSFLENPRDRGA